jgi:hypothetical protein
MQDLVNDALECYLGEKKGRADEKLVDEQPKEEPVQANAIKYDDIWFYRCKHCGIFAGKLDNGRILSLRDHLQYEPEDAELPNNKAKSSPLVTTIHD